MRGDERGSEGLFSYVRLEERIAADHPLRAIRALVNEALAALSGRFDELYSHTGRPSIAPEYLLRATLLQAFFTVRSERQLMEQIDYNLLFRWFVGLSMDDAVWDASTFSKNRDRLLEAEVAREFLATLLSLPQGEAASVERSLLGGRNAVEGLGFDEELPAEGRQRRAARGTGATASATSAGRSARTRRMRARPIPMPSSIARATARRAGCASWAMC